MAPPIQLGQYLISLGLINKFELLAALRYQRRWGVRLGEACVHFGFLNTEQVLEAVGKQRGAELVRLKGTTLDQAALGRMPVRVQRSRRAVPYALDRSVRPHVLEIATEHPWDFHLEQELAFAAGCRVRLRLASRDDIDAALLQWHGDDTAILDVKNDQARPSGLSARR